MHIVRSARACLGLFPLLSLFACAADVADDDEVEAHDAPLVGGTNTSLRPEIGLLFWGSQECTATLVGSRYVLSAAHCTNHGTSLGGGLLKLPNSSTNFSVSKIHVFGANRAVLYSVPDGANLVDDVELLQLSSAVPSSVASPSLMAPVPPSAGLVQTIFGYGCKNRSTGQGDGVKQYVTFTSGSTTQVLCSGDSGGPVVNGSPTAAGPIWAVNSGYDTQHGVDSFGAATRYKEDMLSLIRNWEGTGSSEVGVARIGVNYSIKTVASITACMQACQDDVKCHGFTYFNSLSRCELKSSVGDWYFNSDAQSMINAGLATELLRTRPGSAYSSFNAGTIDACLEACAVDNNCKAYTLTPSGGVCQLKNAVPAAVVDFMSVSGVKRNLENNVDRPGPDYSHASSASAAACLNSCANDYRCRTFTWVGNVCYLHATQTQPVARTGAVSGVKRGLEINTDRPGADYKNYDTSFVNTALACQADCAADAICRSFTWAPAGWHGRTDPHCWLKNGVPATTANDELVSGIKGMDFF